MVNKVIRWLLGYVIFTASGKFPERLLNLSLINNIILINPKGEKEKLTACVSINDYRNLCRLRKKADVTLKVQKKIGLPFILHRNRKRKGLLFGGVIFLLITYWLSQCIWTVEIHGNRTMSICEVQNTLRECGIYTGAWKNNIDVISAERKFALLTDKVGWMSVNFIGCKAQVEISESYGKPEIIKQEVACNLKAKKSGQILKMNVAQGKNIVAVGDGVAKGQLLVSGIFTNEDDSTTQFVHSSGEVLAGVQEKLQATVRQKNIKETVFEQKNRQVIRFLNFKIPLSYEKTENVFYKNYVLDKFVLNNTALPFEIITEENFGRKETPQQLNQKSAEAVADTEIALQEIFCFWDYDIQSKEVTFTQDKENYLFTANYYCIEDIAEAVEIVRKE